MKIEYIISYKMRCGTTGMLQLTMSSIRHKEDLNKLFVSFYEFLERENNFKKKDVAILAISQIPLPLEE